MTLEAVIGQNAAQIGVVGEIDAEQIPRLALPPAGAAEQPDRRWHRLLFVGVDFDADALIEPHAEEVVDHLEALRPVGKIGAADVAEHSEGAIRVVAEKFQGTRQCLPLHPAAQLAALDLGGDHRIGQRCRDVL